MADVADLALILFLPWFAILGALYWYYPRTLERTPARRRFDVMVLVAAFAASFIAGRWGFAIASTTIEAGPIWRQVLASLLAYKAFLAVLAAAWAWRGFRFRLG
ncbi:MAG: hypothetical protein K0M70_16060 [Arenimonas sp.]|uniref:hypothetical protein n=1 Tax=Arenimonas sp. TaxID=1872635 RepID=UPI0025BA0D61|nr:hypothetical protein [Arenimonas sp.]MBW8369353.1 hypothetical protein [Arenimonas sp.]